MINALIFLLKKLYKTCRLKITDVSGNKEMGDLSSYYLAFYQKTWYERDFNAYLEDDIIRDIYNKQKEIFNNKPEEELNVMKLLERKKIKKEDINNIMNIYNNVSSYKEFFKNIKENIKRDRLSSVVSSWINTFINIFLKFAFIEKKSWIIDCDKNELKNYECKINELKDDPFPKYKGNYISITKRDWYLRQIGGGMERLEKWEKKCLKRNINWIGWNKDFNKYCDKDKEWLYKIYKKSVK